MTPEEFNKFCESHQKDVDSFTQATQKIKNDFKEIKKIVGLNA